MKIFAISDPHLAFSTPNKSMDVFGENWIDHPSKIKTGWLKKVRSDDVVIVPGDISWATSLDKALADLNWLDSLPGTKIILKGNHDLWWEKAKVMEAKLPSSIHFIQNNHVTIGDVVFFGSRLWDTQEYSFDDIILWDPNKGNLPYKKVGDDLKKQEKIYARELERLNLSIKSLPENDSLTRIGLCHYPPLDHKLEVSKAARFYINAKAKHVVFGHLHSLKPGDYYGEVEGTHFHLTSCDYIGFVPKLIYDNDKQ